MDDPDWWAKKRGRIMASFDRPVMQDTMRGRQELVEQAATRWQQFLEETVQPITPTDPWARYRERIIEGTQQAEMLKAWQVIAELTKLAPSDAVTRLRKLLIDEMDESAFVTFRNAMVLVNNTYAHRAGVADVQDPVEWERRYIAYLRGGDPEAPQYENYFHLRAAMDQIRKPKDVSPPYNAEELELGRRCNQLFNSLAFAMDLASPFEASQAVVDKLTVCIEQYRALLGAASPDNRSRRQALEAIAAATYAMGRICAILKDYTASVRHFQSALEQYEALHDALDAQTCRRQLAALRTLTGDVDSAMQANLELLTTSKVQVGSLDRAAALVSQMKQALNANDVFEALHLLESALEQLRPYPDPFSVGVDEAFAAWTEMVPARLRGTEFASELARIIQLYAETVGARAILTRDAKAAEQAQQMLALAQRCYSETFVADNDLQQRFKAADARPLAIGVAAAARTS
jgi:tetratricopeptide (TPR) repeat protein